MTSSFAIDNTTSVQLSFRTVGKIRQWVIRGGQKWGEFCWFTKSIDGGFVSYLDHLFHGTEFQGILRNIFKGLRLKKM